MNRSLDNRIREALAAEVKVEFDPHFNEQSLIEQAMQIFRGRNRWVTLGAMFWGFGFMVFAVYSMYQFYWATEVKAMIGWTIGFMFSALAVSMMKLWAWMEMEKYTTIREIKRLELQLALMQDQQAESSTD